MAKMIATTAVIISSCRIVNRKPSQAVGSVVNGPSRAPPRPKRHRPITKMDNAVKATTRKRLAACPPGHSCRYPIETVPGDCGTSTGNSLLLRLHAAQTSAINQPIQTDVADSRHDDRNVPTALHSPSIPASAMIKAKRPIRQGSSNLATVYTSHARRHPLTRCTSASSASRHPKDGLCRQEFAIPVRSARKAMMALTA